MNPVAYEYRAVDKAGAERRGVVAATDQREAFKKVSATGATPISLKPVRAARRGAVLGGGGVKPRDIAQFTHQLAVLLEARIPIADAVRGIAEQETNPRLQAALNDIAGKVQSGSGFAAAMAEHQRLFGQVYVETIRAAEKSGSMLKMMDHLAEMLERQSETRQQVRQAMTYPIVVLTAIGVASLFLIAFVVPKFAAMFAQRGARLPFLTEMLQALGISLKSLWWVYGGCFAGTLLGLRRALHTSQGRALADRILHRVPYLRRVLIGLAMGRFARVFGLSLGAGVGLIESLDAAGRASARPLLMKDAARMIDQVRQGGRLSEVLRTCAYVPPFACRMLSAGEESAELPRMSAVVARHYETETSRLVKNASTVIEPMLIALLTGVVLVIALAIFLPMWDMVGLMK